MEPMEKIDGELIARFHLTVRLDGPRGAGNGVIKIGYLRHSLFPFPPLNIAADELLDFPHIQRESDTGAWTPDLVAYGGYPLTFEQPADIGQESERTVISNLPYGVAVTTYVDWYALVRWGSGAFNPITVAGFDESFDRKFRIESPTSDSIRIRNVWLEIITLGDLLVPPLRQMQRDDGLGIQGHARLFNGYGNQPSSVSLSRAPRLPGTEKNRYV